MALHFDTIYTAFLFSFLFKFVGTFLPAESISSAHKAFSVLLKIKY